MKSSKSHICSLLTIVLLVLLLEVNSELEEHSSRILIKNNSSYLTQIQTFSKRQVLSTTNTEDEVNICPICKGLIRLRELNEGLKSAKNISKNEREELIQQFQIVNQEINNINLELTKIRDEIQHIVNFSSPQNSDGISSAQDEKSLSTFQILNLNQNYPKLEHRFENCNRYETNRSVKFINTPFDLGCLKNLVTPKLGYLTFTNVTFVGNVTQDVDSVCSSNLVALDLIDNRHNFSTKKEVDKYIADSNIGLIPLLFKNVCNIQLYFKVSDNLVAQLSPKSKTLDIFSRSTMPILSFVLKNCDLSKINLRSTAIYLLPELLAISPEIPNFNYSNSDSCKQKIDGQHSLSVESFLELAEDGTLPVINMDLFPTSSFWELDFADLHLNISELRPNPMKLCQLQIRRCTFDTSVSKNFSKIFNANQVTLWNKRMSTEITTFRAVFPEVLKMRDVKEVKVNYFNIQDYPLLKANDVFVDEPTIQKKLKTNRGLHVTFGRNFNGGWSVH